MLSVLLLVIAAVWWALVQGGKLPDKEVIAASRLPLALPVAFALAFAFGSLNTPIFLGEASVTHPKVLVIWIAALALEAVVFVVPLLLGPTFNWDYNLCVSVSLLVSPAPLFVYELRKVSKAVVKPNP